MSARLYHRWAFPCCINFTEHLGDLRSQELKDIYSNDNEKLKNFRKKILNGPELPDSCIRCATSESVGKSSMRTVFNKRYEHILDKIDFDDDGNVFNFKVHFFDLGLSNRCNLKCRSCQPMSSSSIGQEFKKHNLKLTTHLEREYSSDESDVDIVNKTFQNFNNFLEFASNSIDTLNEIHFEGGEPILHEDHYKLLDFLLEKNKTDVILRYHSNMTRLHFRNYNVLEYWKKFKNVRVNASIDAAGKELFYIRSGADWNTIVNNLKSIRQECPHIVVSLCCTMQVLNSFCATKVHHHLTKENLIDDTIFNVLQYPKNLSLTILPASLKEAVTGHWKDYLDTYGFEESVKNSVHGFLNFMNSRDDSYLIPEFLTVMKEKDDIRKESLANTFTRLYNGLINHEQ